MMIEIQDLEGVQKRCPPKEDQHKKNCSNLKLCKILKLYGLSSCFVLVLAQNESSNFYLLLLTFGTFRKTNDQIFLLSLSDISRNYLVMNMA